MSAHNDTAPFVLGNDPTLFPSPHLALKDPNGLLAVGGDLSPERLLSAYRLGIFPWFNEEPILWWCPHPRTVLFLNDFKVSRSLKKTLRHHAFEIRTDLQFKAVLVNCAGKRLHHGRIETQTWLSAQMQSAYFKLFELGYAHSIEVYSQQQLVGGLYGVSIGRNFFGESMFSHQTDASKVALYHLVNLLKSWGFEWIDCQVWSPHLASLGATEIAREQFLEKVAYNNQFETKIGRWTLQV